MAWIKDTSDMRWLQSATQGQWRCYSDSNITYSRPPWHEDSKGNDYVAVYAHDDIQFNDIYPEELRNLLNPVLFEKEPNISEDNLNSFRIIVFKWMSQMQSSLVTTDQIESVFEREYPDSRRVWVCVFHEICVRDDKTRLWKIRTPWQIGREDYMKYMHKLLLPYVLNQRVMAAHFADKKN